MPRRARRVLEVRRKHADNVVSLVVEPKRLADDVRGTGEARLPEAVTDDRDRRAGLLIVVREAASERHPRMEHFEVARRIADDAKFLGLAGTEQRPEAAAAHADALEDLLMLAPVEKVARHDAGCYASVRRIVQRERDQPIGAIIGKWAQDGAVDDGEDGRVRADTQREGCHCRRGEAAGAIEDSERVRDIVHHPPVPRLTEHMLLH